MKSGAELLRAREPARGSAHSGDRRIMQMAGIPGLHFIASGLRLLWERHAWLAAYFTVDLAERKLNRRYLPPTQANRARRCAGTTQSRPGMPAITCPRAFRVGAQ